MELKWVEVNDRLGNLSFCERVNGLQALITKKQEAFRCRVSTKGIGFDLPDILFDQEYESMEEAKRAAKSYINNIVFA